MYLANTDFNANNPFNYQTSLNLTPINTPSTSNVFTSVPSTSFQEISCRKFDIVSELSDLNTIFTQEPTLLNDVNDPNLQILNSSHNEDQIKLLSKKNLIGFSTNDLEHYFHYNEWMIHSHQFTPTRHIKKPSHSTLAQWCCGILVETDGDLVSDYEIFGEDLTSPNEENIEEEPDSDELNGE
ncbi:23826_t:CDS:2, partial [Gigaspora rosea]